MCLKTYMLVLVHPETSRLRSWRNSIHPAKKFLLSCLTLAVHTFFGQTFLLNSSKHAGRIATGNINHRRLKCEFWTTCPIFTKSGLNVVLPKDFFKPWYSMDGRFNKSYKDAQTRKVLNNCRDIVGQATAHLSAHVPHDWVALVEIEQYQVDLV